MTTLKGKALTGKECFNFTEHNNNLSGSMISALKLIDFSTSVNICGQCE